MSYIVACLIGDLRERTHILHISLQPTRTIPSSNDIRWVYFSDRTTDKRLSEICEWMRWKFSPFFVQAPRYTKITMSDGKSRRISVRYSLCMPVDSIKSIVRCEVEYHATGKICAPADYIKLYSSKRFFIVPREKFIPALDQATIET